MDGDALKSRLADMCSSEPIEFFGIASVDRFSEAPAGHRPRDILTEAESVVSIGTKIPEGVREANHRAYEANRRHLIFVYQHHGYVELNRRLNETAFRLAKTLEAAGHRSTPIPASPPSDVKRLRGVISNRHAAVAAGNATFGRQGLAVTPEAGPRVRWTTVLTTAALEPDPLITRDLCPEACQRCHDVCPVDAFEDAEDLELEIGGQTYRYPATDKWRCNIGGISGMDTNLSREQRAVPDDPGPEDYLATLDDENRWDSLERVASMCGRCIIECPIGQTS